MHIDMKFVKGQRTLIIRHCMYKYLSTLLVGYALLVEVIIEHGRSLDAELCLEGTWLVVDAHVNHTAIVTSLVRSYNQ